MFEDLTLIATETSIFKSRSSVALGLLLSCLSLPLNLLESSEFGLYKASLLFEIASGTLVEGKIAIVDALFAGAQTLRNVGLAAVACVVTMCNA